MSKFLIDILLATAPLLSTYFYCRSNRRTAALLLLQRASSIGLLPLRSFMFVEAPCINSTSMASVLLNRAATCRAVEWISPLRLFTSAPLLNNNSVTSVLFFSAARWSAAQPNLSSLSTGTPTSIISFTSLTSPSLAAKVKRRMSSSSISRREMEITIKQFDVWEIVMRMWMFHLIETIHHLISFKQ